MNRHQRRAMQKQQHEKVSALPEKLTPIPSEEFPKLDHPPVMAWRSRYFLVQLYQEQNEAYPGLMRLSVCRVRIKGDGKWQENIKWEELQAIKREIGAGEWYGVEIYPPDSKIVNVSNHRHLWLLREPLTIGWMK